MAHADHRRPALSAPPGLDRSFDAVPDSVGTARTLVTSWLQASLPDEELLLIDVALATSEACTNVVMHAYAIGTDGGSFNVLAERHRDTVIVTVSDHGRGMVPRSDSPGLGLGLPLIASLAETFEMRVPVHGSGTVLEMRFSAAGAAQVTAFDSVPL